jgi:hypothetical protein
MGEVPSSAPCCHTPQTMFLLNVRGQFSHPHCTGHQANILLYVQRDQKVSEYLMITIQTVTRNVQSVPRQSPYIY